jgi:hypothetical protein
MIIGYVGCGLVLLKIEKVLLGFLDSSGDDAKGFPTPVVEGIKGVVQLLLQTALFVVPGIHNNASVLVISSQHLLKFFYVTLLVFIPVSSSIRKLKENRAMVRFISNQMSIIVVRKM